MDFLNTLLAYMAAMMVVAVESTATPGVTPEPTPTPTAAPTAAVETVTEIPSVTATPEPAPTVSVTPRPVPTITPNVRGYHNLAQGDRGADVKRLQERLIELGYLAEGSADGAYGGKTRLAVRRFQYYNGLTVDGIAGRATQTNLFENPEAAPAPSEEPPSEEPDDEDTVPPSEEPDDEDTVPPEETAAPEEAAAVLNALLGPAESAAPEESPKPEESAAPEESPAPETAAGPAETGAVREVTENVDLDAQASAEPAAEETPAPVIPEYEDLAGWVVLNDSGENMQWTETADGIPVVRSPRLQRAEEDIRVSLEDICRSVPGWTLSLEDHSAVLEAEGQTLAILREESGPAATVNGVETDIEEADFDFGDGSFIRVDFLTRTLDGSWEWDGEEETLMIRIPPAEGGAYTD